VLLFDRAVARKYAFCLLQRRVETGSHNEQYKADSRCVLHASGALAAHARIDCTRLGTTCHGMRQWTENNHALRMCAFAKQR